MADSLCMAVTWSHLTVTREPWAFHDTLPGGRLGAEEEKAHFKWIELIPFSRNDASWVTAAIFMCVTVRVLTLYNKVTPDRAVIRRAQTAGRSFTAAPWMQLPKGTFVCEVIKASDLLALTLAGFYLRRVNSPIKARGSLSQQKQSRMVSCRASLCWGLLASRTETLN